jgi:hypothetical protein
MLIDPSVFFSSDFGDLRNKTTAAHASPTRARKVHTSPRARGSQFPGGMVQTHNRSPPFPQPAGSPMLHLQKSGGSKQTAPLLPAKTSKTAAGKRSDPAFRWDSNSIFSDSYLNGRKHHGRKQFQSFHSDSD